VQIDGETRGATRGASIRARARAQTDNVSRVLLKLLADDVGGVEAAGLASAGLPPLSPSPRHRKWPRDELAGEMSGRHTVINVESRYFFPAARDREGEAPLSRP